MRNRRYVSLSFIAPNLKILIYHFLYLHSHLPSFALIVRFVFVGILFFVSILLFFQSAFRDVRQTYTNFTQKVRQCNEDLGADVVKREKDSHPSLASTDSFSGFFYSIIIVIFGLGNSSSASFLQESGLKCLLNGRKNCFVFFLNFFQKNNMLACHDME